jgi:hypothetical protein
MAKSLRPPPDAGDLQLQKFQKVSQGRKNPRPAYYNSASDQDSVITFDTEEALILVDSDSKRKAVDYLKSFSDAQLTANDHNELLQDFTAKQTVVSNNIIQDIQLVTGKFQAFRDSISKLGDSETEVKSGLAAPLTVMVKALGRVGIKESREIFHRLFTHAAKTQYVNQADEALKRELRSWVRVFVSYP